MRRKTALFFLSFLFAAGMHLPMPAVKGSDALAQGGPGQARPHGPDATADLPGQIQAMVARERQEPTTAANVGDRRRRLTSVISAALRAGIPVREVFSRDDDQRVESLLNSGSTAQAAEIVHGAILKLERLAAGPGVQPSAGGPAAGGGPSGQGLATVQGLTPSRPILSVDVHGLAVGGRSGSILKLMNPVVDSERRRVYICGSKSTTIGVIDADRDELIETFDIGMPGGFLLLDPENGDLYMFDMSMNRFYRVDIAQKRAVGVQGLPAHLSLPRMGTPKHYKGLSYVDKGYPFQAGYLQQENASYGIIEASDRPGNVVSRIKHGPDAHYFCIDENTGKLYASNTGDGTISVFDLEHGGRKTKDIHVGTAIQKIALDPNKDGLFIVNRLGGSVLYRYGLKSGSLKVVPNENTAGKDGIGIWPTDMVYDSGKLFVLSHYAGRVDVVDAKTYAVTGRIPLGLPLKPRTDAISCMLMDAKRGVLFAAFPEMGLIAVADVRGMKSLGAVRVEGFDTAPTGPGRIVMGFDDVLNRLFVYLPEEKALRAYDGGDYSLIASVTVDAGKGERLVLANPGKGVLYAGNKVLDSRTLQVKSEFSRGVRVVAFDNKRGRVYLSDMVIAGPARMVERVYEFTGDTPGREWALSPVLSIPSSFAFDFAHDRFFVGYFETARVEAFGLSDGD